MLELSMPISLKENDPLDGRTPNEPRGLHFIEYRERYKSLTLEPGELITPEIANEQLIFPCIFFRKGELHDPQNYELRRKDKVPIGAVDLPGKSAFILYGMKYKQYLPRLLSTTSRVQRAVLGTSFENSNIAVACVQDLLENGIATLYTPTPNNPLHLRLIPYRFFNSHSTGSFLDNEILGFIEAFNLLSFDEEQ